MRRADSGTWMTAETARNLSGTTGNGGRGNAANTRPHQSCNKTPALRRPPALLDVAHLNIAMEDPVEYRMPDIIQTRSITAKRWTLPQG